MVNKVRKGKKKELDIMDKMTNEKNTKGRGWTEKEERDDE